MLCFTALLAVFACECCLEAMARASALAQHRGQASKYKYQSVIEGEEEEDEEASDAKVVENSRPKVAPLSQLKTLIVGEQRIEMPQLCNIFLGARGQQCYLVSISLYIYSSLWAYAVLVAQVFKDYFLIQNGRYLVLRIFLLFLYICRLSAWLFLLDQMTQLFTLTGSTLFDLG